MTRSRLRSVFLHGATIVGAATLLLSAPTVALAQEAPAPGIEASIFLQAQPAQVLDYTISPGQFSSRVIDTAGVLSSEQAAELEGMIHQLLVEQQKSIFVVYMPSFGGYGNTPWAEQAVIANGGGNTLVLAIATEDRQYGLSADTTAGSWTETDLDNIEDAIFPSLVESNWPGASFAAVDNFLPPTLVPEVLSQPDPEPLPEVLSQPDPEPLPEVLSQPDPEPLRQKPVASEKLDIPILPLLLLTLGFLTIITIMLGIRLILQKRSEKNLAAARDLIHTNRAALATSPTRTLETLAAEAIINTKNAVHEAQESLAIYNAEFGEARTRPFKNALLDAQKALWDAQQIQRNAKIPLTNLDVEEPNFIIRSATGIFNILRRMHQSRRDQFESSNINFELNKRVKLTAIVTSCDETREELNANINDFAAKHRLLLNAESELDQLRQESISLRARIAPAEIQLLVLNDLLDTDLLQSINSNIDLAISLLDQAVSAISSGYEVIAQPAGQQGQLISILQNTKNDLNQVDKLLSSVEEAKANIASARDSIQLLINEAQEEIQKAQEFKFHASDMAPHVAWEALDQTITDASHALSTARHQCATDPLGSYSNLLEAHLQLQELLNAARDSVEKQERQLETVDQLINVAQSMIEKTEALISSNSSVDQTIAQATLTPSKSHTAKGESHRIDQPHLAAEHAHQAGKLAEHAHSQAQTAITTYEEELKAAREKLAQEEAAREEAARKRAVQEKTRSARAAAAGAIIATKSYEYRSEPSRPIPRPSPRPSSPPESSGRPSSRGGSF